MADDLTLAQRVRAKYPGAYAGLSDTELETRVRAKYPGVYDGVRSTEPESPEKPDGSGALATAGGLAGLAGAVTAARPVANTLATLTTQVAEAAPRAIGFAPRPESTAPAVMRTVASPLLKGATEVAGKVAAPLNIGMAALDYARGKRSLGGAAAQAAGGELARRVITPERIVQAAKLLQKGATPIANALSAEGVAGMAAPVAVPLAGGLAGVAGTTGFLGALQHDANRDVPMDYTRRNLTEDIARVLGGAGATEAQMDDPSHPAFRADDSVTVAAQDPETGIAAALLRLLRGGA